MGCVDQAGLRRSGRDRYGCFVDCWIAGDELKVQHGDNPEAVRWFYLDANGQVAWGEADSVVGRWFDEIHAAGAR